MRLLSSPLVVILCVAIGPLRGQTAPAVESVVFDGQTLVLASQKKNASESLKEYIPPREKLESWTTLASIREYTSQNDPMLLAKTMAEMLKKQNPDAQSAILQNQKTGDVMIDFVTWPADSAFVEFNVFKFTKREGGGIVAQQYAIREYKQQSEFLKNLKALREKVIQAMGKDGLTMNKPGTSEKSKE